MKHYAEIVGGIALALLGVILFIALLAWGCLEFIEIVKKTQRSLVAEMN